MATQKLVRMIVGTKLWQCSRRMAMNTIELAKQKYKEENVNAIVAVEKNGTITLLKDVHKDTDSLIEEVTKWTKGKYKVYYVTTKQNGGK